MRKLTTTLAPLQDSPPQQSKKQVVVFFSYAREDEQFVKRLSFALAETGIDVQGDWSRAFRISNSCIQLSIAPMHFCSSSAQNL